MKSLKLALIAIITITLITVSCSSSPKSIALDVAEEWTSDVDTIASMSNDITELFLENITGVDEWHTPNIKNQIGGKTSWNYSEASKLADNSYSVIATSTATINVPITGVYRISADYQLTIDTAEREVTNWDLDASSFAYTKLV